MLPSALSLVLAYVTICTAFKYESNKKWSLSAPNTLCASGIPGGLLGPCPKNKQEMDDYDAIVMDEHGYVDVTISGLYFTSGRRRLEEVAEPDVEKAAVGETVEEPDKNIEQSDSLEQNEEVVNSASDQSDEGADEMKSSNGDAQSKSDGDDITNESTEVDETKGIDKKAGNDHSSSQTEKVSKVQLVSPNKFHIQVYLVSLDIDATSLSSQTQPGITSDRKADYLSYNDFLSGKEGLCCYEYANNNDNIPDLMKQCTPMDMRTLVPRTGMNQKLSAPMSTASSEQVTRVSARFRPVGRGRHMVVISNCAAELDENGNATPLLARFDSIKFKFVSKFGELPLSMMGIVPFYGVLLALYGMLGLLWFRRSKGVISCPNGRDMRCKKNKSHANSRLQARPLLGLQRAIYSLILLQFVFTLVAFAYYVHLNITVVDIDVLYGGTMAAVASVTPFSVLVGLVHFITFLACQAVVMLATDGTWLIQSNIRDDTKRVLYALGTAWACFFVFNTFLSQKTRLIIIASLGFTWLAFLIFNVRRSLRHLRSLILGQSNETVIAVGGNLVAKRSMYRKMFAVVAIYPVIFAAGVIWNVESQADKWAWVGYVLVDVFVFIILLHASIAWLPRPLAAMEYAKYTPLDHPKSSSSIHDDRGIWDEDINYNINDLELP